MTQRWDAGLAAASSGVVANAMLGASSLYWRELGDIPPVVLVGYRILLSLPTLLAAMWMMGRIRALLRPVPRRVLFLHAAAASLVVINWGTFIWASIHGHVLESGLGYLIAPCVAIFAGVGLLREKISKTGVVAMGAILAALMLLVTRSGELNPAVYLTIAITWGAYACLKKVTPLDALHGLIFETAFLAAACLLIWMVPGWSLQLPSSISVPAVLILSLAGFVSVFPLILFGYAAARLPLSVMGLFQFVLPTTQLVVAVLIYKQPASTNSLVAFGIIWAALALYLAPPLVKRLPLLRKKVPDEGKL